MGIEQYFPSSRIILRYTMVYNRFCVVTIIWTPKISMANQRSKISKRQTVQRGSWRAELGGAGGAGKANGACL